MDPMFGCATKMEHQEDSSYKKKITEKNREGKKPN